MKKLITICVVMVMVAATAGVRAEAVSTSEAWIDWTTLTITGDITWSTQDSKSYAYAEDDTGWIEDSQGELGWVDTDAFALTGYSYGIARTRDAVLYEQMYAIANEATTTWAYTNAYANRWGSFSANSDGLVTFSAEYGFSQDLRTDYVGEMARGYAEAWLYLVNDITSAWDEYHTDLRNTVWDGDSMTDSAGGTMTVTVGFNALDSGYFEAWVWNDAEVLIPEPATLGLLLLGGLAMLWRRCKSA